MSNRKVILKMVMSLDGFATSLDGAHEWMFEWFGDDSMERNLRALEDAGVHAMGRRSYEIMGPHWTASQGQVATAMNEKPKAVFSHTLKNAQWGPAEIFAGELSAEIAEMKARDDAGTILIHGGPTFAASATRLGLVDEYQLSTIPIAIGAGRSPFAIDRGIVGQGLTPAHAGIRGAVRSAERHELVAVGLLDRQPKSILAGLASSPSIRRPDPDARPVDASPWR